MRTLAKLTLVEMKLFIREPVTMFFTFALPLLFLFVMGGVFGNLSHGDFSGFRDLSAMDFYTPAYIALVLASVGVVGLPVHLPTIRSEAFCVVSGPHQFLAGESSAPKVWLVSQRPV